MRRSVIVPWALISAVCLPLCLSLFGDLSSPEVSAMQLGFLALLHIGFALTGMMLGAKAKWGLYLAGTLGGFLGTTALGFLFAGFGRGT